MSPASPTLALPDHVRAFLDGVRYATIGTTDADGGPRQAVIWYLLDGDELVVNSRVGRRWPTNLLCDPRCSLAVTDAADGMRWVGLSNVVEPVTEQATAQADIAAMARRYNDDPDEIAGLIRRFESMDRISFRFRVGAIHDHLA